MSLKPTGAIPDAPGEERGADAGELVGARSYTLPEEWDLTGYVTERFDQRGESCQGASWARALILAATIAGYDLDVSYLALWTMARELEHRGAHKLPDEGVATNRIIAALTDWGVVARARWPEMSPLDAPLPIDVLEAASRATVTGFFRVYETGARRLARVREALHAGHGVVYCGPVGEKYMAGPGALYKGDAKSLGNHARVLTGYRGDGFREVGSYGERWNGDGTAWVSEEYVAEQAFDLSVVTVAPAEVL